MESGAVPPPRRATPRTLVGSPPNKNRPTKAKPNNSEVQEQQQQQQQQQQSQSHQPDRYQYTGGGAASGATAGSANEDDTNYLELHSEIEKLRAALDQETAARKRYQTVAREESSKMDRLLQQQSQMDMELVSRDAQIESLSGELRLLKTKNHGLDTELAQATADYLNSQTTWIEQVDALNDEIRDLKAKHARSQAELAQAKQDVRAFQEKDLAEEEQRRKQKQKQNNNVQVQAEALEKHQNELLIKELRSYHAKLKEDIKEIQEVNERLREENEQYQYLLVESTVNDSIVPPRSVGDPTDSAPGMSLADDEVVCELNELQLQERPLDTTSTEPTEAAESVVSETTSVESWQRTIARQNFELRSLQNHNRALKLSLERLVDRLLDNQSFSRVVEESISTSAVQRFRRRVASCSDDTFYNAAPSLRTNSSSSSLTTSSKNTPQPGQSGQQQQGQQQQLQQQQSSIWSNMIFNSQYTGTANRRVFSLGVDNEAKGAPPPSSSDPRAESNTSRVTPMKYAFGRPRSLSPLNSSPELGLGNEIEVAKRADSVTGIRKLRLAD